MPIPDVPSDDFLVGCTDHKEVLLVIVRIELDAIADLFVGETGNALTRLGVPQLDEPVVGRAQKPVTRVVKVAIPNGLPSNHGESGTVENTYQLDYCTY